MLRDSSLLRCLSGFAVAKHLRLAKIPRKHFIQLRIQVVRGSSSMPASGRYPQQQLQRQHSLVDGITLRGVHLRV